MIDRISLQRMDLPAPPPPGSAPPAGTAPSSPPVDAAAGEPILCGHCGRTASNGISCQGMCVADSGY
jgi:hypothetical protein